MIHKPLSMMIKAEHDAPIPSERNCENSSGDTAEREIPYDGSGGSPDGDPAPSRLTAKESRRNLYPNGVDILAIAGILLISALAASLIGGLLMVATQWGTGLINALTYFLQMAFAIGFVVIQRRIRKAPANVINLKSGRVSAPLILWGVVLIFVTGVVIEPVLELFPDRYLDQLNQYIGTGGWSILMTVVLAPVMEETLFRGLIQGSIYRRDGAARSILLSALLFGIFHFIPQQVINAFLIGIILGYIYFRTRSLLTVIILHALNNGVSYMMLELLGPQRSNMPLREMVGNDAWYYVIYGICALLAVTGAVMIFRSLRAQDEKEKGAVVNNMEPMA